MPRPHRRDAESGIHHVMNRGVDHQAIFFSDADRLEFGGGLATIHDEHDVTTLAYCLMTNHFHLLLSSPPGELSAAMHQLTSVYSHQVNNRLGRDGPLFRGRFHSIPVETDSYLVWATRYIHRNPLDLPGIASPEDHRWSSYRAYLGLRPIAPFLDVRPVLDLVGGAHLLAALTEDPSMSASTDDLTRLVECAMATDDLRHGSGDLPGGHLTRTVMVLLAERSTDPAIRHGANVLLGHRSPEAARVARHRAERRLQAEPAIGRILAWVEQRITTDPSLGHPRTVGAWHRPYADSEP